MKIVLTRPNYDSHFVTPPLSLGYLASYLKKKGIEAVIIDGLKDGLDVNRLLGRILSEEPDAVGITCLTAFYYEVIGLARRVKAEGYRCIIGGVHPTFLPFTTLVDSGADFVVCGEGEIALSKLADNGFRNASIPGVYSVENIASDDMSIERGEIIVNLDDLPFPDWQQIDPNTYPVAPHGAFVRDVPIGVITTSRGCPCCCTFCASPNFYNRRIRYRSPENVISEIKYLVENFNVKEIHFEDDNLTFKKSHVIRLCNLIIENRFNISWCCPNGLRVDKIDEEILRLMVKSGCYYIAFGIESADERILQNIRKQESPNDFVRAIDLAHKVGLLSQGFLIFGLPGETKESMEKTIKFVLSSKLSKIQVGILDVIPGSNLWYQLRGEFKPNWRKKYFKEPEWLPAGLTRKDLMNYQEKAFRLFYFRPHIILNLLRKLKLKTILKQMKFLIKILRDYRIFGKARL